MGGSIVKSAGCFSSGPEFGQLITISQLAVTLAPGDPRPSSGLNKSLK